MKKYNEKKYFMNSESGMFIYLVCVFFSDRDDCTSLPCMHDSVCEDLVDGYNCQCALGYTGDQCQTGITKRTY